MVMLAAMHLYMLPVLVADTVSCVWSSAVWPMLEGRPRTCERLTRSISKS